MRIYNKKGFASGIFSFLLGSTALITGIIMGVRVKSIILGFLVLSFGVAAIARSLSQNATTEDKIAAKDERNHLVANRSQAKTMQLIRIIAFILTIILLIIGARWQVPLFLGMGISTGILWNLSYLIEIGATIYYEKHL